MIREFGRGDISRSTFQSRVFETSPDRLYPDEYVTSFVDNPLVDFPEAGAAIGTTNCWKYSYGFAGGRV